LTCWDISEDLKLEHKSQLYSEEFEKVYGLFKLQQKNDYTEAIITTSKGVVFAKISSTGYIMKDSFEIYLSGNHVKSVV